MYVPGLGRPIVSDLTCLQQGHAMLAAAMTAGHSNTDHIVVWTNDYETDRIAELKHNMLNRVCSEPEHQGEGQKQRFSSSSSEVSYIWLCDISWKMTAKIHHENSGELDGLMKIMNSTLNLVKKLERSTI